jgi:hypothetical protein
MAVKIVIDLRRAILWQRYQFFTGDVFHGVGENFPDRAIIL